jgi:predicted DNA-binding WGR domain protein
MKLIHQVKLFFQEGNSDKVYEIDLCEISKDLFAVNFRYGKRNTVLKEGSKTPAFVPEAEARKIFSALEKEKRDKGYVSLTEIDVVLPEINQDNNVDQNKEDAILKRLQDAINKTNSFKTEWKTSKVIWKAAVLNMKSAKPFIIKLIDKGDEMQVYAALWALIKFNAVEAEPIFRSYANQPKQKDFIKNIAHEGLMTILQGDELQKEIQDLYSKIPEEIIIALYQNDEGQFSNAVSKYVEDGDIAFFSKLYILAKRDEKLSNLIFKTIQSWPLRPPYFKVLRSMLKISYLRNDYPTFSHIAFKIEKEKEMYVRKGSFKGSRKVRQIIENELMIATKEVVLPNSKIAFSRQTKNYLRSQNFRWINESAYDAVSYIKYAVSVLLHYENSDFTPAIKGPQHQYGMYNYSTSKYTYIILDRPQNYDRYLLTRILDGNDKNSFLQKDLTFLKGKEIVESKDYSFKPSMLTGGAKIKTVDLKNPAPTSSYQEEEPPSIIASAINTFKSFFGKKKEEAAKLPEQPSALKQKEEIVEEVTSSLQRKELYPEHWDQMPQAYVQLLMQAKMDYILEFAYTRLTVHPNFENLLDQFEPEVVLALLKRPFNYSNQLGLTLLQRNSEAYKLDAHFVAELLDCHSQEAITWAKETISNNKSFYTGNSIFLEKIILNNNKDVAAWINNFVKEVTLNPELQRATIGRVTATLLSENVDATLTMDRSESINRLETLCSDQFENISWEVVEQLMNSPIQSNVLLASKITKKKFKANQNEVIPFRIIEKFLYNDLQEVRNDGLQLLEENKTNYIKENASELVYLANTKFKDVLDGLLKICSTENGQIIELLTLELINCLIRKEKFENSHQEIATYLESNLIDIATEKTEPRLLLNLIHCNYRTGQNLAFEILKKYKRQEELSMGQIASIGSHELLALRQWCHQYYNENKPRVKYERKRALALLDAKWEDSKEFAMQYFKNNFTSEDWDLDTIIELIDTPTAHIEAFGLQILQQNFLESYGEQALMKLSEHPSSKVQLSVTNYLEQYAKGKPDRLEELEMYIRSVLGRVNKGRLAKNRLFLFLEHEIHTSEKSALVIAKIIDDVSAISSIEDKATCINILTQIKNIYPKMNMHLQIENV